MNLNSHSELMALHRDEFVYAAYQLMLGRAPDESGLSYYSARLRLGYSKLSVLYQLGTSRECRNWDALPDLRRALTRYRVGRLPVAGWIFRHFWHLEEDTVPQRLQRAIIANLADVSAEIREIQTELSRVHLGIDQMASMQGGLRDAAVLAVAPRADKSGVGQNGPSINLAAERLSPSAKKIFEQLTSR